MKPEIKTAWQTITDALTQLPDSEREVELRVLRGEWEPEFREDSYGDLIPKENCYYLNTSIENGKTIFYTGIGDDPCGFPKSHPHILFAPNEALAKKLRSVILGEWKPQLGESYYFCFADGHMSNTAQVICEGVHSVWDEKTKCFPSEPQRTNYIASLQVNEPKVEEKKFFVTHYDTVATLGFGNIVTGRGLETAGTRKLNEMLREYEAALQFMRDNLGFKG